MLRPDHDRVTNLLAEAAELPPSRRGAFLDSTCLGEPELRRELEELLECAVRASAVFDEASRHIAQPDPERIGPYQIIEPVGEGGMATVYKALQQRPVRRTVALKLIKLGMDTRQFVARFESERQALALMDHPNVAQVYDAGSTETGRPYFVMEYVPGQPLLVYSDARQLSVRQRLMLFIPVCAAVEHAHRKGIIHRDLKNSNVLVMDVDGSPVPKVIDFGVAKVIGPRLSEHTLQTEHGQLIGTPEYMSPEQAEQGSLDIDTRSDIYSLGVLLYELIAGVQPIPSAVLRSAGYEQLQRIIREIEPQRPSTRLGALARDDGTRIAQSRRTALPTLIRDVRSELEWIPLKAMRKDREQRYRSAAELADDLRNYLDGRPLIAGPESRAYRARKFLRRHKAGVAASAGMLLLLIAGIVATTWQAVRATRAEKQSRADATRALEHQNRANRESSIARKQASVARAVNELMTDMIKKANRGRQKGDPNVTVRAVMDAAAVELNEGATSHEPEAEAALRGAIGVTYDALGLYDEGEPLLRSALEQRMRISGVQSLETASAQNALALLLHHKGAYAEAEALYRQALATRRNLLGEEHSEVALTVNNLSALLWSKGDYAAADPLFRETLAMRRKLLGNEHVDVAYSLNNLAALLHRKGDCDAAEPLYREALAMRRKLQGNESTEVASTLSNLGSLLRRKGDYAAAEPFTREALATYRTMLGDEHPSVATSLNNLAHLLHDKGDYDAAERHYREALEMRRKLLGDGHSDTLSLMSDFGRFLAAQGRLAEAEPLYAELYQRVPASQVPPRQAALYLSLYGPCLVRLGRYQAAEQPLRDAYQRLTSEGLARDQQMVAVVGAMAEVCDHTNRPGEAVAWRDKMNELHTVAQPATRRD